MGVTAAAKGRSGRRVEDGDEEGVEGRRKEEGKGGEGWKDGVVMDGRSRSNQITSGSEEETINGLLNGHEEKEGRSNQHHPYRQRKGKRRRRKTCTSVLSLSRSWT